VVVLAAVRTVPVVANVDPVEACVDGVCDQPVQAQALLQAKRSHTKSTDDEVCTSRPFFNFKTHCELKSSKEMGVEPGRGPYVTCTHDEQHYSNGKKVCSEWNDDKCTVELSTEWCCEVNYRNPPPTYLDPHTAPTPSPCTAMDIQKNNGQFPSFCTHPLAEKKWKFLDEATEKKVKIMDGDTCIGCHYKAGGNMDQQGNTYNANKRMDMKGATVAVRCRDQHRSVDSEKFEKTAYLRPIQSDDHKDNHDQATTYDDDRHHDHDHCDVTMIAMLNDVKKNED